MTKDWKDIHPDFTEELVKEWEKNSFDYEETKKWINKGLNFYESELAYFLKSSGNSSSLKNLATLRKKYYNVQKWLDKNYPNQEVKKIDLYNKELGGKLDLQRFVELEHLDFQKNNAISLKLSNLTKLKRIDFSDNKATELIIDSCANLEELNCRLNNITSLRLNNCPQLKTVNCNDNKLVYLNIYSCPQIEDLNCSNNQLDKTSFLMSLTGLKKFDIINNNLTTSNLKIFLTSFGLEELKIGNYATDTYNRFTGSLLPLQNLTSLRCLDISGTDLDSDIEYLPNNLECFYCSTEGRWSKIHEIEKELIKYGKSDSGNFANLLQVWKVSHQEKSELNQQIQSLQQEKQLLFQEQETKINYLEFRVQELTNLIRERKEKIVGVFVCLLPEKEKELNLIQDLVITHLEYTKAKKQKLSSTIELRDQRDRLREKLEKLLGSDSKVKEEIEFALADCEELVGWELELEERLKGKTFLIEEQKQTLKQITNGNEEKALVQNHEAVQQKEQAQLQEEIFTSNYLRNQLSKVEELTQQIPQIIHNPPK